MERRKFILGSVIAAVPYYNPCRDDKLSEPISEKEYKFEIVFNEYGIVSKLIVNGQTLGAVQRFKMDLKAEVNGGKIEVELPKDTITIQCTEGLQEIINNTRECLEKIPFVEIKELDMELNV